jgi:transposase IS4-like protein
LPDRVAIGVSTKTFPPELVDQVIDEAQAREQWKRSLPARLTTYFTLAMWLRREHGYEEVLRQLIEGLSWSGAGAHAADVAWSGSITKVRARLGVEPLQLVFTRVAGPVAQPAAPARP